jgi:hypothetical protein
VSKRASKSVRVGKVAGLVVAQGVKTGTQQIMAKIVHTDIVILVREKEESM